MSALDSPPPTAASPHRALAEITSDEIRIAHETLPLLGPNPVLFAVVTGTHQYGFVSPDGDIDVRGAMVAPTRQLLGLEEPPDHFQHMGILHGREVDGLLFEVERFLRLLLKPAGNLLEEVFSPIVLVGQDVLDVLRPLCEACLTRNIAKHYLGFFDACVQRIERGKPEMKMALYAARLALTGIQVLLTGKVEAHLPTLNESFGLTFIDHWIALKPSEHIAIPDAELPGVLQELKALRQNLRNAARRCGLPDRPRALDDLSQFLIRQRLAHLD